MYLTTDYREVVYEKVDDLSDRVALLKNRLATQTCSVRLEHYWELENIRSSFAEFKWRLDQLGDDPRDQEAFESAWTKLAYAIDNLLAALPEGYSSKIAARRCSQITKITMPRLLYPGTSDRPAADAVGVAAVLRKKSVGDEFVNTNLRETLDCSH